MNINNNIDLSLKKMNNNNNIDLFHIIIKYEY